MSNFDEKQWQAESDVQALAQAEEVKSDPVRLAAAKQKAVTMAKEQQSRTEALNKVAADASMVSRPAAGAGAGSSFKDMVLHWTKPL